MTSDLAEIMASCLNWARMSVQLLRSILHTHRDGLLKTADIIEYLLYCYAFKFPSAVVDYRVQKRTALEDVNIKFYLAAHLHCTVLDNSIT